MISMLCATCSEQVTCAIFAETRSFEEYHASINRLVEIVITKCHYYESGVVPTMDGLRVCTIARIAGLPDLTCTKTGRACKECTQYFKDSEKMSW